MQSAIRTSLHRLAPSHIPQAKIREKNKSKTWLYGYNEQYDVVVISKTGEIGEVYEIEGLHVALPLAPSKVEGNLLSKKNRRWERTEYPKILSKIKKTEGWNTKSMSFKSRWIPYIDEEFDRRKMGHWFMNNGVKTYITGSQYMYIQWSKIDIGYPDFRESNRIYFIFWEACKADKRSYGMCYVKNRRSGFSFMFASEAINTATLASNSIIGMLSKTGLDAKALFTEKVVPIATNYPFFFKPLQDGMDKPKTEISYRVPASKLTKKSALIDDEDEEEVEGLETIVNWLATANNSYDSKKLLLLGHDEAGKWEKPNNIEVNWGATKTTLRLGRKIIGKCMMGSTVNALNKGGSNFQKIYNDSDITKRNKNGNTTSGLYSLFIPMEFNMEGFIDYYGHPVVDNPERPIMGIDGEMIPQGAVEYWEAEIESLADDSDKLNEHYRQFPRTEAHAFRDESSESIFDLPKLYEQVDHNSMINLKHHVTRGDFGWKDGIEDTVVEWRPSSKGNFLLGWKPPKDLQNKYYMKGGRKHPSNEHIGCFGCDSYDISGAVGGGGSKGALHGQTKLNMTAAPNNTFFLEYIARPPEADIFFEDVLMAIVFYGMPILAENTKPRLLYHLMKRGYRGYSMNRPDKHWSGLSKTEKEIGGTPNSSFDLIQSHASALESYIYRHIGIERDGDGPRDLGEAGDMPFQRTLQDWIKFDISDRTDRDASISSGLAIMANQKLSYLGKPDKSKIKLNFAKYTNKGMSSKRIGDEE